MLSETVDSLLDCAFIPETPVRITPYRLMNKAPLSGCSYNAGSCLREADDLEPCTTFGLLGSCRLRLTERARLVRPRAEAARDKMRDDVTDVALLRRLVVGACVVTRNRHGPAAFALLQFLEKARGIFH